MTLPSREGKDIDNKKDHLDLILSGFFILESNYFKPLNHLFHLAHIKLLHDQR